MTATHQRIWIGQVAIGALCVCLLGLVGRLAYIQSQNMRPKLLEWSQERQTSKVPLPGKRGKIIDRRGRVLAGSHDLPTVFADPALITDKAEAAIQLSGILDLPSDVILGKLTDPKHKRYVELKRQLAPEKAKQLREEGIVGVGTFDEPVRVYAMGKLAAHVVGCVNTDDLGLEGIELACEKALKGLDGQRIVYWDARRKNALCEDPEGYMAPRDGLDVVLTIDAAIQEIVEREIAKGREKYKAECMMCVVMSPKTGEILAMAVNPTFSPTEPAAKQADPVRRNRILTDPVEPGSIFKPFVMVGAFEAKLTRPEEVVFCHNGCMPIGRRLLHDHKAYGNLTVEQIITQSSNIGMAIIGMRMGNKRMFDTLNKLGFGHKTGIDLPGEDLGLLMKLPKWQTPYTTCSVPMGQEVALTPIQLVTAFCAFANGGRLVKPHLVAGIVDRGGNVVEDRRPKGEFPQVLDPQATETMHQILIKVVTDGTGKPSQLDDYTVMGKTGTAQIPYSPEDRKRLHLKRGGYEPNAYLGSFLAAAPASDPQIVVLVMLRKPVASLGYYGGTVSAPVAKAIMQEVLPYLNVKPDKVRTQGEGVRLAKDSGGRD